MPSTMETFLPFQREEQINESGPPLKNKLVGGQVP